MNYAQVNIIIFQIDKQKFNHNSNQLQFQVHNFFKYKWNCPDGCGMFSESGWEDGQFRIGRQEILCFFTVNHVEKELSV